VKKDKKAVLEGKSQIKGGSIYEPYILHQKTKRTPIFVEFTKKDGTKVKVKGVKIEPIEKGE